MITKPEQYTKEFVQKVLQDMLDEAVKNPDVFFIGEVLVPRGFHKQRYSDWKKKFAQDHEIVELWRQLEDLLESRIVKGGLKEDLSSQMSKFVLINKHDWKDKQEIAHSGKVSVTQLLAEDATDDELNDDDQPVASPPEADRATPADRSEEPQADAVPAEPSPAVVQS